MCTGAEPAVAAEAGGAKGAADIGAAAVAGGSEAALGEVGINTALAAGEVGGIAEGATAAEIAATGAAAPLTVDAGASALGTVVQTAKTVAPAVSAASSLVSAIATADQAQQAKEQADKAKGMAPAVAPPLPQSAVDPDLTMIRKKNAMLFGLDSPASTDLTKGAGGLGNVGRSTLLGGSTRLGA